VPKFQFKFTRMIEEECTVTIHSTTENEARALATYKVIEDEEPDTEWTENGNARGPFITLIA
jgi:hypothetical protein